MNTTNKTLYTVDVVCCTIDYAILKLISLFNHEVKPAHGSLHIVNATVVLVMVYFRKSMCQKFNYACLQIPRWLLCIHVAYFPRTSNVVGDFFFHFWQSMFCFLNLKFGLRWLTFIQESTTLT